MTEADRQSELDEAGGGGGRELTRRLKVMVTMLTWGELLRRGLPYGPYRRGAGTDYRPGERRRGRWLQC